MLGTHMSYKYRYPDTFNYFQREDDLDPNLSSVAKMRVNEFDNAIRYHDSILNQLLDIIQQQRLRVLPSTWLIMVMMFMTVGTEPFKDEMKVSPLCPCMRFHFLFINR